MAATRTIDLPRPPLEEPPIKGGRWSIAWHMYFQRLAITISGLQGEPPPSGIGSELSGFDELAGLIAASMAQVPPSSEEAVPPSPAPVPNTDDFALSLVPTGVILPFGGSAAPDGYLLCDGSARSRTEYAALFAVIGTAFGAGDGSTTFNVPNADEAVLGGFALGSIVGANEVDISHSHGVGTLSTASDGSHDHGGATGAAGSTTIMGGVGASVAPELHTHSISSDGSHTHSISGSTASGGDTTHDNRPKTLGVNSIIKV